MSTPELYMLRCIEIAQLGIGKVAPNPMVGCVIVCNGKIIGEGYHEKFGEAHAEVNAIRAVKNNELLKNSTLYVSLEPCAHFGKTPPCSDLIIKSNIPKVVVGTIDPFSEVAGKGIEKMKQAGINVESGLLENECRELNRRFFTFHIAKRPYIVLKWAQTLDGFIDAERNIENKPTWITNELCKRIVHKQRSEESAVLIGTNTAEHDNPKLTVREWSGTQPLRLVIDRNSRLDPYLNIFDGSEPTWVFSSEKKESALNTRYFKIDKNEDILKQILDYLYSNNVMSVIVEGGLELLKSFIASGNWDEAHIYTGNKFFSKGVIAPQIDGKLKAIEKLDDCFLNVFLNRSARNF